MNNTQSLQDLALDPLSLGIGFGVGALAAGLVMSMKLAAASREKASLEARLDSERALLGDHFRSLAQTALQSNNEQFLALAGERLKAAQERGASDLDKRTVEIEKLVKPIEKELVRLNTLSEQMQGTDKALRENLLSLQRETSKLSGVLRNPSAQGKWGEFVLETILDKANLIKGVHYNTQVQVEGGRRPDVIINLHDGFRIAIDSKAPINEYVSRLDEDDISNEELKMIQSGMAKAVRAHVKSLGAKTYQDNIEGSDFVILFLPSEVVFSATLRADPEIVDYAAENHVVIASPTLIISLLRVVGLSWRQVEMAKNAADIAALGADLHKRFTTFLDHFQKIGKGLGGAVQSYEKALGSMNRMVMPAARKFEKIHAHTKKSTLQDVPSLEQTAVGLMSLEDDEGIDQDPQETKKSPMDKYKIITVPDPVLKQVAQEVSRVDEDIRAQFDRMLKTMYEAPGIGLAANQVSLLNRVIVMDVAQREEPETRNPICMANPEIIWESDEPSVWEEGCLSIPGQYADVHRPLSVRVRYVDYNGRQQEGLFEGLASHCVQHEIDHLNGVLFIDHLSVLKRNMIMKKIRKQQKDTHTL